jgi:hypothetical protein
MPCPPLPRHLGVLPRACPLVSNRRDRTLSPWDGRQNTIGPPPARRAPQSAYAARPPWMRLPPTAAHGPAYVRLNAAGWANDNAPSADRIVCRGRAGEWVAPPRVSISDSRQPTKREVEAAVIGGPAASQGGISIRIASSQSNRRTWPAHCLLCQFGLARLVSAGRRPDAPRSGCPRQGPLVPTSTGPLAVAQNAREGSHSQ